MTALTADMERSSYCQNWPPITGSSFFIVGPVLIQTVIVPEDDMPDKKSAISQLIVNLA
jgi:hypothetical protein